MARTSIPALIALLILSCGPGGGERTLVVAVPYAHRSLDPHRDTTLSSHMSHLYNVYESLVQVDADLRIRPALAESWSTPDERTWIFALREARFHSGRALSSADVVDSLRRAREGDGRYYLADVEAMEARGPRAVVVRTREPSPTLGNRLSFVLVVPQGARDLDDRADGTGPYEVASWQPGERLVLRAHAGWWGPPPAVRRFEVRMGQGAEKAVAGLLRGEIDLAQLRTSEGLDLVTAAGRHVVQEREGFYMTYLGFRVSGPGPFRDRRVRRAVHLALDRESLVRNAAQARPAAQLVSRYVFGFDPALTVPAREPDIARDLLRQAGLGTGFEATLSIRPRYAEVAEGLRGQLGAIGIRLRVESLTDDDYFARLAKRDLEAWVDNWGCTTGDSGELFENAFHSPGPGGRGAFNESGVSDPALDRDIDAAARLEADPRRVALQGIMRTALAEGAWLPLYHDLEVYAVHRSLTWQPRPDTSIRLADAAWRP